MLLDLTGSAETFNVEILLPQRRKATAVSVDGRTIATTIRQIEESMYLVLPSMEQGAHRVEVKLT